MIDFLLSLFCKSDPCSDLIDALIEGTPEQIASVIERSDISPDDLDWVCNFMASTLLLEDL